MEAIVILAAVALLVLAVGRQGTGSSGTSDGVQTPTDGVQTPTSRDILEGPGPEAAVLSQYRAQLETLILHKTGQQVRLTAGTIEGLGQEYLMVLAKLGQPEVRAPDPPGRGPKTKPTSQPKFSIGQEAVGTLAGAPWPFTIEAMQWDDVRQEWKYRSDSGPASFTWFFERDLQGTPRPLPQPEPPAGSGPRFNVGDRVSVSLGSLKGEFAILAVNWRRDVAQWEYQLDAGGRRPWITEGSLTLVDRAAPGGGGPRFRVGDLVTVTGATQFPGQVRKIAAVEWDATFSIYMYRMEDNAMTWWAESYLRPIGG